ncbi:cordon-bleu protein-like 1b isoform X2 [Leuresthes tenuis]
MDQKENLIDKELSLTVVLPGGVEKMTVVHGSKPLMDLLVTLCAKYHLNPSSHTLELVTANSNNIKLKPNALIGTLDAEKIILKPKGEDKNKKMAPQMPEATVRMVINYKKSQKTILRVNPRVPLAEHLPAICEKCEFNAETTVLLRDIQSSVPLDLSNSLNDYAIREVYARDTKGQPASAVCSSSPTRAGEVTPGKDKNQKEKENKGLFSMFRKSKKKAEQPTTASAPASPVLASKPRPLSMALPCTNSSPLGSPTFSTDVPKKRRAPQPPILVSQSCHSDLSTPQTPDCEPNTQLDSDQMIGVSRGSSAESSLKRTKRKAPPPPTSPSALLQETVSLDETLQETATANTLEEIMEQEETTASVKSTTTGSTQEAESSLNLSPEVSLHTPSPDIETASMMSVEGSGEDQSIDLSSDGNQLQSTLNDSALLSSKETDPTESSMLTVKDGDPPQVEDIGPQPICEEPIVDSADGDCSASSLLPPITPDAEAQASVQTNTETLRELTYRLESSVTTSTLRPSGEDAEVQTDFSRLPVSPQEHKDKLPSSGDVTDVGTVGSKDMSTLTEELEPSGLQRASSTNSEPSPCQDSPSCAPAATKVPSTHAIDSEPKRKPSNELMRDYIPKVGMTTYTIVPQKSLEKLRYFEVALTLETPPEVPAEGLHICPLDSEERTGQREQTDVSKEKNELHSNLPREDLLTSTTTTANTTTTTTNTTTQHTVNGSIPEYTHSSSPTSLHSTDKISSSANEASQAPAEVKEMKIPPATKPKPTSFHLAQHKKTPGYYVTSAAEKSLTASPGSGLKETQGKAERAALPPPPPPPPPVQCREETAGATNVQLSPKPDDKNVAFMKMTRQSSVPSREPVVGLSLDKFRSFAAPRPYSPATPSRFAQAVSSAVKRSHSVSHRPKSPPFTASPPISPITSHSSVRESKGLAKLKDCENKEMDTDGSTLQREDVFEMANESSP